MTGTILNYNMQSSEGIISGANGQRYTFKNSDWNEQQAPNKGQQVDFADSGSEAHEIYFAAVSRSPSLINNTQTDDLSWVKSNDEKLLAGVCAGVARKLEISVSGCRVATFLLTLFFGLPLLIYIVLWLILPSHPTKPSH